MPPEKRDPNLLDKLNVERDGIFMWALAGLKRLIANSYLFSETAATRAELQRYRVENNSVLLFVEEYCEFSEKLESLRDELYVRYREFCVGAGLKSVSQTGFNKEMESCFLTITRSRDKVSKRRTWKGIGYCEGGRLQNDDS